MLLVIFVLVSVSTYERFPLKGGLKYSNIVDVLVGRKNDVLLQEVAAM
jgi:hypothetical protein